ncbi:MAG: hypothetical protein M1829_003093 [Trizodia sp. TS-e1964]|nr:MAG: hypothetical protein M1829_003093 [Trizodia sp. TS-e1964]
MRQCLTSTDGYYTRSRPLGLDPFGRSGDFVTSPEISQVFGELVGIWFVAEWMAQGRPQALKILELGPGRGTLMVDTLRALRNFKGFVEGLEGIHLVEASAGLRDVQRRALCGDESVLEEVEKGWMCRRSKYVDVPVFWYEDLRFVPNEKDKAPFIVAHEFFDALPIHAFQSVRAPPSPTITTNSWHPPPLTRPSSSSTQQWRELLVTTTPPSPITTTTTKTASPPPPEFHLLLSPHPTPHSLILPTLSPRYAALLAHPNSTIEICPDAHAHTRLLTSHLCTSARGAALLIDYGSTSTPISTLRGVRAHALTSPFSAPGEVDLSADVDFSALGEAARGAGGEVHGPVEQGAWLGALGGWERVEMLAGGLDTAEGERVRGAWKRPPPPPAYRHGIVPANPTLFKNSDRDQQAIGH